MAALNDGQRAKMISQFMSDKENLLVGVSSVLTPGRRPLKPVQENTLGTPETFTVLKKTIARSSLTPNGLNQKNKRKSKRLSIPVHVFRRTLKQSTRIRSPLKLPPNSTNLEVKEIVKSRFTAETKTTVDDNDGKDSKPYNVGCKLTVVKKLDQISEHRENKEKEVDSLAEIVVNQVFKDIAKSSKGLQETESYEKKIQEFTQIILQMNKERLELEKNLSICKKEVMGNKNHSESNKEKLPNAKKNNRCKESKNHLDLVKNLSQKNKEIQQLKRELQQAQPGVKTFKVFSEKELEAKREEVKQLKIEVNQLQHQVREVPGLKNELQKSRQQVTLLNEITFTCRRENNSQKTLLAKIQKELSLKDGRAKQHLEEYEKNSKALKKDLIKKEEIIVELREVAGKNQQTNDMYKLQSESLCCIVDRLETVSTKAQKFKSAAELKVQDLSSSLIEQENLCINLEEQLQSLRNKSTRYRQGCEQLDAKVNNLQHEVDIGNLELSRQQIVITSLEDRLEKLRVENCNYQDQFKFMHIQQQEMNEFLGQEKTTLEETANEMERELWETRYKGMKLDETFKETTVKCEELEHEIKLSRSLYLDKQEELDATQSQAHCIMFQLQNEITDAQECIADLWGVLDALLGKFREQANLEYLQAQKNTNEEESKEGHTKAYPSRSLVQSILAAVSKGTEPEDSEDQPSLTLCTQITELKQGLQELARIGYGQAASEQATQKIAELEQNRESMEVSHKRLVQSLQSELDTCHANETNMKIEIQRGHTNMSHLTNTLNDLKEQLQYTMRKNDSMSHLLDVESEQREKIKLLNEELSRKEDEYKRIESEKECMVEQLNEMVGKVNELCNNPDTKTTMAGKVLEEKFAMERKLKQIKGKYMEYRLKTDDRLSEQKITSNQQIQTLERNLNKAEAEICRLDEILEKIRIVLHKNQAVVDDCPSLSKVLRFLDGDESDH